MKKELLFLSFLATLIFSGCSKDENSTTGEEDSKYGYVAVSIVQPKSVGTRADASDGFEYGSENENKASEGLFFIFNTKGTGTIGAAQRISLSPKDGTSNPPEVEKIYNAVLVITGETTKPETGQIVCILNAPAGLENGVTTLEGLTDKIGNYGASDPGQFIMSNSVYQENNETVLGAMITDDNIKKSATEAYNAPVRIYVERVVAKVRAKTSDSFKNEGATVKIDGVDKAFNINITGIEIANIAKTSYLFKNINGINYNWTWNDPSNKRSYWETVPTGLEYDNFKSSDLEAKDFDINNVNLTKYIQPNSNQDQKTSILVTAQLQNENGEIADLAYILGGYTTQNNALNLVGKYLAEGKKYYKKVETTGTGDATATTYQQLNSNDLEWKNNGDDGIKVNGLKTYEWVAQLADPDLEIYTNDGTKVANGATTINNFLTSDDPNAKLYRARVFIDGKCYYFVDIDQTPVAISQGHTGDETFKGVIRNHIYDLTLQSIKGIGVPFNPAAEIIPENPSDEETYYLAAKINVLAWRLVEQGVDFTGQQ